MINIQKNISSQESRKFTALPSLLGLFMNYLNSDAQGQFILKPRDSATSNEQKKTKERPDKKQKTSKKSWFHRGSVPHQEQVCTIPRVNKGENLFGKELNSICPDGNLPSAILDMLSLLNNKGPTTEGIFIVPPDISLLESLKEKFASGEEVDINNQSVHEVAWMLKEFIQNVKGSLMTSTLYNEWLAVLEKVNEKEKLLSVQSLIEKLPPPNAALLTHLFRILHKIERNSSVNQVPSYALSFVIAPCLLFLDSSHNEVLASDIDKKTSLVTFMIEKSPKIFGEDIVPVWYETSLYYPHGAKPSCSESTLSTTWSTSETELSLSSCSSSRTCSPGYYALPRSRSAPLLCEGDIGSVKREGNVYTTRRVCSQNQFSPVENYLFEQPHISICEDKRLPAPILQSIIKFTIDNCVDIFGDDDDDITYKDIQNESDTAGELPVIKEAIDGQSGKTYNNAEKFKISSVSLQEEGPIAGQKRTTATSYKW
uniref:rho GTPase-activating protein 20-like isoform X1 n=1 Tax=Arvicanthis niloticus TaxID=61156 RepID=UPI00148672F8|nr:rho GTPase-activating protein 20-like isoform X1 [Arvicanthis niloticus]